MDSLLDSEGKSEMKSQELFEYYLKKYDLEWEDIKGHFGAWDYLCRTSSEAKLKSVPVEVRERIGKLLRDMRGKGFYPGPIDHSAGVIRWQEMVDRLEARRRHDKKQLEAPKSLEEYDPALREGPKKGDFEEIGEILKQEGLL